jgi:hypothetical protein
MGAVNEYFTGLGYLFVVWLIAVLEWPSAAEWSSSILTARAEALRIARKTYRRVREPNKRPSKAATK